MSEPGAPRRTGTVRRGALRPPPLEGGPARDRRAGSIALTGSLILTAALLGWLIGGAGGRAGGDDDTPDPVPTATATPSEGIRPTLTPTATAPSTPRVSPSPTPSVTPSPSPEPTRVAPSPTPAPAPAEPGLVIEFPRDGEVVGTQRFNVIGAAPPGATITRDIPFWFDDHTTADDEGLWLLPVELAEGPNRLVFRIGDDRSTEQVITVTYRPGG